MHTHSPKQDPQSRVQDHPSPGQEFDRDVHVRITVGFAIGIIVTSILTMIGMWYLLGSFMGDDRGAATPPRVQQSLPPEPRLQVHPELELKAFVQQQDDHLQSYGWVEQSEDRGHIAIEDAMKLIVEQGLPVRSQPRPWQNPLIWRNPSLQPLHPGGEH